MKTERIELSYGSGTIPIHIPEDRLAGVYRPREVEYPSVEELEKAVGESDVSQFCRGMNVSILLEDETRGNLQERYLEALLPALAGAKQVKAIVATGSHDHSSVGNLKLAGNIKKRLDQSRIDNGVYINDCRDSEFSYYGKTSYGTEVRLNSQADDAETVILPSTMKPHYFAGYSNPVKNIMPGMACFKTIEQNHSLALEKESTFCRHPLHPDEKRRGNPVAEDMMEAAALYLKDRRSVALAVAGRHVFVGDIPRAASSGMSKVDELMGFSVAPEKYVIVSPGKDYEGADLYRAQRGLELTKYAVRDGGEVLLVAEMAGGITYDETTRLNFHDRLKTPGKIPAKREEYVLYSHKAVKLNEYVNRVDKINVFSSLDDAVLEDIRMAPAKNCQHLVDAWLAKDTDSKILVFDHANRLAVY